MANALAYVPPDELSGRAESVVLPYGMGGEFGLARLVLAGTGTWEVYQHAVFQERIYENYNLTRYCRIAAHGRWVFVGLWRAGVGVWEHVAGADRYRYVGVLRVPRWNGASPSVTDLTVQAAASGPHLVAAVTGSEASDPRTGGRSAPRACVWSLAWGEGVRLQAQGGLDVGSGSTAVSILGEWSRPWGAVVQTTLVVTRPATPTAPTTTGVATSVVGDDELIWLEGPETIDVCHWADAAGVRSVPMSSPLVPKEVRSALGSGLGLRVLLPAERMAGVAVSAGPGPHCSDPAQSCGAPAFRPVGTSYPYRRRRFNSVPTAVGALVMTGTVQGRWWLAGLPASGDQLIKAGELERFSRLGSGMFEQIARSHHGTLPGDTAGPSERHILYGAAKAHLGRIDFAIPDPFDPQTLATIEAITTPDTNGQSLQVTSGSTCEVADGSGGCVPAYPPSRYRPLDTRRARVPCLPGSPPEVAWDPDRQWPYNACAEFADDCLPPNVGWGYGGEWMDGAAATRVGLDPLDGRQTFDSVVFLADRGSGTVSAHASALGDGRGLDVYPGFDPYAGLPYSSTLWPCTDASGLLEPCWVDAAGNLVPPGTPGAAEIPETAALRDTSLMPFAGYFPGRDRVPGCRSVAVMSWPHAAVDNTLLVATVGYYDARGSLYLVPFRWEQRITDGRFVYTDAAGDHVQLRFPLNPNPPGAAAYAGRPAFVRTVQLAGREQLLVGWIDGGARTRPADFYVVDPATITSPSAPELLSAPMLTTTPGAVTTWDLPRRGDGTVQLPGMPGGGPPDLVLLDARESGDRVYVLAEGRDPLAGTPNHVDHALHQTYWVLTLLKQPASASAPFVLAPSYARADTHYESGELQRLKVSPNGRWISLTFGSSNSGLVLLHVPEGGYPQQVGGIRADSIRDWQGWDPTRPAGDEWDEIPQSYSVSVRGGPGVPAGAPAWPLPEARTNVAAPPPRLDDWRLVGNFGTGSELVETPQGTTLLLFDTTPITIWELDPALVGQPAPWRFVGAAATEGSQRMRVAWSTPDGVFFMGDRGTWAIPACRPLTPPGQPPVRP